MKESSRDLAHDLKVLLGEKLSSVTFVLDYWQLDFDGQGITIFSSISVKTENELTRDGDPHFRDRLCEQIGKIVKSAEVNELAVVVVFKDSCSIEISFREEDYQGPEAFMFCGHAADGTEFWYVV